MGIIAKQSIRGTIVTYIGVAIGFVTTFFVLTRFLSAEEIGLARVLIDAATLFIGLAQLGTNSSIIRFFPYFKDSTPEHNHNHGFFFWTLVVPFVGFLIFTTIYWACHLPLSHWFGEKSPLFVNYYYFVLPMAFFMLYQAIFETNANVLMHIVVPRAVREIVTRVGLLATYLLYAFHILSLDGMVIALCVVYAVAALCNIIYLFTLGHISLRPDWQFLRENRTVVRNYLFYTSFLIISAIASVLAPTLSSFFITAKMGLDYTGIFAIATYIAVMVSIPYRSVTAIASPQLAAAIKDNDTTQTSTLMQQCANNLCLIGGFILCAIWINIDLIFHILPNGETYAVARDTVFILSLTQLIFASFNICLSALNYSRFYYFSLLYAFVLTALSIILNNTLIPLYGMEGAALSNIIANVVYFLLIVVTLFFTTKTSPFSWKMILSVVLIVCILAVNFLWNKYLPISNIWLSSILRSILLLGGAAYLAYRLHLSPELDALVRKVCI